MRTSLALILLLLFGCQERPETKILARVNGMEIAADHFRERLHEFYMGEEDPLIPSPETENLKKALLQEMILEKIMLREAEKRELEVPPAVLRREMATFEAGYPKGAFEEFLKIERMTRARFRERLRNQILLKRLRKTICSDVEAPSEEEVKAYYETHEDKFHREEQLRIRQIVVKNLEDGEKVRSELSSGADFGELAKKHSFGPEGAQGGDLGYLNPETLPEPLGEAAKKLKVDQVSPVVETEHGFHVVKVTDKRKSEQKGLEQASTEIRNTLMEDRCEDQFTEWRHEILSKSKIERNHGLLSKLR